MNGSRGSGGQPLGRDEALRTLEVIHECLEEGLPLTAPGPKPSARTESARRIGISPQSMGHRIEAIEREYGWKVDLTRYNPKPLFTFDDLPSDGEPSAEELIARLTRRHAQKQAHHEAAKLRQVQVNIDGPIAIAFFGDPHVDDPGCAWGDLERDVRVCRDTEAMFAVDVGDDSNNWVGRLMSLYANQEVTSKQALKLIEWFMLALPWLLRIKGNHDEWNGDKGDPAEVMHRLHKMLGGMESAGARLQLNLPSGCSVRIHVRHDFPGGSQFNPAHALVKETLFGYRDHILACGHRHHSGYIPIFHNDPERRLCHGLRLGTYKDFDKYAKDKGFQDGNWARSMAAVIDPDLAHDPVRFIKVFYSLEDAAEYLQMRRATWAAGQKAVA